MNKLNSLKKSESINDNYLIPTGFLMKKRVATVEDKKSLRNLSKCFDYFLRSYFNLLITWKT